MLIKKPHLIIWVGVGLLLLISLVTEMTPILLGMGDKAKVDWGFFWVTMHYIVLPIICIGLVVLSLLGTAYAFYYGEYRLAMFCLAPAMIPALYLAGLFFYPGPLLVGFFK